MFKFNNPSDEAIKEISAEEIFADILFLNNPYLFLINTHSTETIVHIKPFLYL
jgi:hypothetical protein